LLAFYTAKRHCLVTKDDDKRSSTNDFYDNITRQRMENFSTIEEETKWRKSILTSNALQNARRYRPTQLTNRNVPRIAIVVSIYIQRNIALGRWVSTQQADFKKGTIGPERHERLDRLSRRACWKQGSEWDAPKSWRGSE
jgi:hypothetical protein